MEGRNCVGTVRSNSLSKPPRRQRLQTSTTSSAENDVTSSTSSTSTTSSSGSVLDDTATTTTVLDDTNGNYRSCKETTTNLSSTVSLFLRSNAVRIVIAVAVRTYTSSSRLCGGTENASGHVLHGHVRNEHLLFASCFVLFASRRPQESMIDLTSSKNQLLCLLLPWAFDKAYRSFVHDFP
jgi:hypothetical protein